MRRLVTILTILILFPIVGCASASKTTTSNKSKTNSKQTQTTQNIYAIGETANVGGIEVTVYSRSPYPPGPGGSDNSNPRAGFETFVLDVGAKNTNSDTRAVYQYEMSFQTPDGFHYQTHGMIPPPAFPEGNVQPGETVRGNVTFQVLTGKQGNFVFDKSAAGGEGKALFKVQ